MAQIQTGERREKPLCGQNPPLVPNCEVMPRTSKEEGGGGSSFRLQCQLSMMTNIGEPPLRPPFGTRLWHVLSLSKGRVIGNGRAFASPFWGPAIRGAARWIIRRITFGANPLMDAVIRHWTAREARMKQIINVDVPIL